MEIIGANDIVVPISLDLGLAPGTEKGLAKDREVLIKVKGCGETKHNGNLDWNRIN